MIQSKDITHSKRTGKMRLKEILTLYFLLLLPFYFWEETIVWIAHKLEIPGMSILLAVKTTYRITQTKAYDIYHWLFDKLGPWFWEPDFTYFVFMGIFIAFLVYWLWSKWYMIVLVVTAVFFPQISSLILLYLLISKKI